MSVSPGRKFIDEVVLGGIRKVIDYGIAALRNMLRAEFDRQTERLAPLVKLDPDRMYTPKALAQALGYGTDTIYRWVKEGILPQGTRPGERLRKQIWTGEQLIDWLESLRVPGQTHPIGAKLLGPAGEGERSHNGRQRHPG